MRWSKSDIGSVVQFTCDEGDDDPWYYLILDVFYDGRLDLLLLNRTYLDEAGTVIETRQQDLRMRWHELSSLGEP
jgi:hypothetical protein